MNDDDQAVPYVTQAGDSGGLSGLEELDEQASGTIRRVFHDGRWFFSVIDVVGLLTGTQRPRRYWSDMKRHVEDEWFCEVLANCQVLTMPALDGKMRQTDCADFTTMMALLFSLPAWKRNQRQQLLRDQNTCKSGVYAITNIQTQEQYIGSSNDITLRLNQHRMALRRGNHHAKHLQEAWDKFGENAFRFELLEEVTDHRLLGIIEQHYLDAKRPASNSSSVAHNSSALSHISPERIQSVLLTLFEISGFGTGSPMFCVIRDALLRGILTPGPNFSLMLSAERNGVQTPEELSAFIVAA